MISSQFSSDILSICLKPTLKSHNSFKIAGLHFSSSGLAKYSISMIACLDTLLKGTQFKSDLMFLMLFPVLEQVSFKIRLNNCFGMILEDFFLSDLERM